MDRGSTAGFVPSSVLNTNKTVRASEQTFRTDVFGMWKARETHVSWASRIVDVLSGPAVRRPVPKVPPLNDALAIEFDMDNPKRAGSTSWEFYDFYKSAKTVGEARQKGASTGHVLSPYGPGLGHRLFPGAGFFRIGAGTLEASSLRLSCRLRWLKVPALGRDC